MYRIGVLFEGVPPDQTPSTLRALEETLREVGGEGRNLVIERRSLSIFPDRWTVKRRE